MKLKDVREKIGYLADEVIRWGDGMVIARRGFYYKNGKSSKEFAGQLADLGFTVLEHGEVDKPFKGGAGVSKNSHFWVVINNKLAQLLNIRKVNRNGDIIIL